MNIRVEAQLSAEVKPQGMRWSAEISEETKCKARVGWVEMVIWTTKHKCKAVKRMEGALGNSADQGKTQGADEVLEIDGDNLYAIRGCRLE